MERSTKLATLPLTAHKSRQISSTTDVITEDIWAVGGALVNWYISYHNMLRKKKKKL